ncbi:MAG: penicillin-binding protein 2 [Sphaerobacter sp.]|nr:penicillin-binding protein 2 [Sphaerobacter sp.]
MELVRVADRKRRRGDAARPADAVFLTRRAFLLKSLVLAGFGALAAKLWKMQIVDAAQYKLAATASQFSVEPIRAPRGLIVDRNGNILAENRISWTVSIVPARFPDDPAQAAAITEQLIRLLDLRDLLVVRRSALPEGSEEYVLRELAALIAADPGRLIGTILRGGGQEGDLVVVREDLPPEEAARLREDVKRLPGVHVMDRVRYTLEANPGAPRPVPLKQDVAREVALAIESNRLYLRGVEVSDTTLVRRYPAGPEFSHILGYVGPITREEYEAAGGEASEYLLDDWVGRGGIEQYMESVLRGRHGLRWTQVDAHGVRVGELASLRREPIPGYTVVLTIDRDLQRAVTQALREGIAAANAAAQKEGRDPVGSGVVVALDPRSGAVLALVSWPTFDNQLFVDGISQEQYDAYLNDPFKPLTNFAISGEFPPGSTIKPLMACIGLADGVVTPHDEFRCVGRIRVPVVGDEDGGQYYYCWQRGGHGWVAAEEAIAVSCDVYFYNVGAPHQQGAGFDLPLHYYNPGDPEPHFFHGLGIERIHEALTKEFNLGRPTGIELAGEASGLVPTPKWLFQSPLHEYWSVGDTINVSIGQGHLAVTPLQLACGIAAIANGGTYYRPRLVQAITDGAGNVIQRFEPEVVHRLNVPPEHIETVRRGMRRTVTDRMGTAYGKFVRTGDDIPIAGKTGTAEYGVAVDGRYTQSHAWFTAFAPYDNPEIVVVVLIPAGGEGAVWSTPVADAVLAAYFGKTPQTSEAA